MKKIKNSNILKILAKFYANVTDDKYNIDNLKITEKLLLTAKINIEQNNKPSDEDNLLLLDIFHDLSVTYLRLENYKEAYFYLKKALSNKENLMYDNNKIDKISNLNICILYSNKALIEMRLEMWEECIRSCDKLIQINPTFENVLNGSCNYYKGRSYHSMKKYKDAILSYNKAIRSTANNFGFLYYYRGITKYALNDIENACIDFKIGCDNGIESSCNRYNNLCNK
jgi:tetratricopeptide (TPR) repeat protein